MERKNSLSEKIAIDVEEITSSLLPKKSGDAYYKELNDFNNCCWVISLPSKRVVLILILILCITVFDVQ
jgi:hypothetical protein